METRDERLAKDDEWDYMWFCVCVFICFDIYCISPFALVKHSEGWNWDGMIRHCICLFDIDWLLMCFILEHYSVWHLLYGTQPEGWKLDGRQKTGLKLVRWILIVLGVENKCLFVCLPSARNQMQSSQTARRMEVRRETEDEAQNCPQPLLLLQICSNLYLQCPSHADAHILQLLCKEIEEIVRSLHSSTVHTHV